jgi:nitrite reductase (NO-forming)
LPPAKDFVLVQSEFYLNQAKNGIVTSNFGKMVTALPDIVAFNGRPMQYHGAPVRVKRGERVRFYVVSAGPTHPCAFHVVGYQFETVYLGSPPESAIHGVQTFSVPAGGGLIFEFTAELAGQFPFVNHGFGHGQKGAAGLLIVEP